MEQNTIDLLCRLPHAGSLDHLCDLAYQILGCPVFVSDLAHTILAYTKCVEVPDETWQTNVVRGALERNTLFQDREVSAVHDSSAEERRPVLVQDTYLPYPRIIKVLVSRGQAMGVLVATAYFRPFAPDALDLTELIASFVTARLAEDRRTVGRDGQTVENYLLRLLGGADYTREQADRHLEILGYRKKPYTYVLSVCADRKRTDALQDIGQLIGLFRALGSCHTMLYNTTLVCLYGSDTDITDWPAQAPALWELMEREGLLAGVSRPVESMDRLRDRYREAQQTLEICLRLGRQDRLFPYDSYASFLLFGTLPRDRLGLYCHERIQRLGAYDAAHGTELCATLQVYLEQAKSLARTAEILFVHRNTVRYRIRKAMELMNTDLEDGNDIFSYILSLRILEFIKKIPAGAGQLPADNKEDTP